MLVTIAFTTLLLSAFFSGVEIAFVSANKLQLELDKSSGRFPSKIIAYFSKNESDFITTMLVGNNTALVVYGIVMTKILTPLFSNYPVSDFTLLFIQTIITTIIILVTAEFLPKTIFRIFPNTILKLFSIPIWLFFVLFRPITILMLKLSNFVLRYLLKQNIEENKVIFGKPDLDEYLNNIKINHTSEDNSRVEVEMLQNVLDLSNKKLRECMIPRTEIIALDFNSTIKTLRSKFIETKLSKILIYRDNIDKIVGYVHSSDLFKDPRNIRSILLPIPIVPESMLAIELLNLFIDQNKGVALVVDEFGGTSGMLTIEDVTEEIVGEIEDEYDKEQFTDKKINNGEYLLNARVDVEDVNKKYKLNLPDSEEYETIAGLLLSRLEDIPKSGDIIEIDSYVITIKQVDDRSIHSVHLHINDT